MDDNIDVYMCPGNHYSMSEAPRARFVGSILATAVGFKYHGLYPQLHQEPKSFKQRRSVQRFKSGVTMLLHSKKGIPLTTLLFYTQAFLPNIWPQDLVRRCCSSNVISVFTRISDFPLIGTLPRISDPQKAIPLHARAHKTVAWNH